MVRKSVASHDTIYPSSEQTDKLNSTEEAANFVSLAIEKFTESARGALNKIIAFTYRDKGNFRIIECVPEKSITSIVYILICSVIAIAIVSKLSLACTGLPFAYNNSFW